MCVTPCLLRPKLTKSHTRRQARLSVPAKARTEHADLCISASYHLPGKPLPPPPKPQGTKKLLAELRDPSARRRLTTCFLLRSWASNPLSRLGFSFPLCLGPVVNLERGGHFAPSLELKPFVSIETPAFGAMDTLIYLVVSIIAYTTFV